MQLKVDFRTIDIHAHILYGFDDGARTKEEASLLVNSASAQGIEAIIATPHYSRRSVVEDYGGIQSRAIVEIKKLCDRDIEIFTGNETVWHEELPERIKNGQALTLASSRYVLIEFAEADDYDTLIRAVRNLENYGYIPIIAHFERYACLRENGRLRDLKNMHAMLQMNFDSLAGSILDKDLRWCRRQVKEGLVDFLATDMHRTDFRPPDISRPAQWLQNNLEIRDIERMTYLNPLRIIESRSITNSKGIT